MRFDAALLGPSFVKSKWDADIEKMVLSDSEKDGLQVYRNYTKAFEAHRAKEFVASVEPSQKSLEDLSSILRLIVSEEPRTLPVVLCAFADDQLKEMFRREIPQSVPGGRNELLSGFGPLSRLSQRIQIAFAFSWFSEDVLQELDQLRRIRNDIAHKWDLKLLETRLSQLIESRQFRIEQYLGDGVRLPENFHQQLSPIQKFRVRLVWLAGRVAYEAIYWVPALKQQLVPHRILYGQHPPSMLHEVSVMCVEMTRTHILKNES